jgi:outer membrane murein-binding lipoprotein Lpp
MKKLALLATIVATLLVATAGVATARVEQAAEEVISQAQNSELTVLQDANRAVDRAQNPNRAAKQEVPKAKGKDDTGKKVPETGGFITGTDVALLGLGAGAVFVAGRALVRRIT